MHHLVKQVDINGNVINKQWKIKNPNAIYFDSDFERKFYLKLKNLKINFIYHPAQRELMPSFKIPALSRGKSEKIILSTVRPIRYSPDFEILCDNDIHIFIETKGQFEDGARLRYKLFQKSLQKNEFTFILFNLKECNQFLNILTEQFIKIEKFKKDEN